MENSESEYWDGEEVGDFEEIYMAQDIIPNVNIMESSNNLHAIPTYYDEESVLNDFSLFDRQGGDAANSKSNSRGPIGLSLGCMPSLLNLLRTCVSEIKEENVPAANFPILSIEIGNWQRFSVREGDLIGKIYYGKNKLVWEMLEGALKYKIEMRWSDISAIKAHKGILEIELNKTPSFFKEKDRQPMKHTEWAETSDFTRGQASVWRTHIVRCQPETLDKHYAKLLRYDHGLFEMSQRAFPIRNQIFNLGQGIGNTRIFQ